MFVNNIVISVPKVKGKLKKRNRMKRYHRVTEDAKRSDSNTEDTTRLEDYRIYSLATNAHE